jgi:8-oxo-dGTP pyrophosphatase MutT (NUDIX family)
MEKEKKQSCSLIIDDGQGKILLQLRDNNNKLPYPDCWGTFGGGVKEGETPEQAIIRELKEELDYDLVNQEYFCNFPVGEYDIHVFIKTDPNIDVETLKVYEGQKAAFFSFEQLKKLKFAYNCKEIVEAYFKKYYNKE